MSYAVALLAEEERAPLTPPKVTVVDATITVTASLDGLSFSSSNPLVTTKGTDISLQPADGMITPVNYNLLFVASSGIASFQTPAAEIWLDGTKVGYTVSPNSGDASFSMAFLNNLTEGPQVAFSFTIFWNSTLFERNESEDPTILLDPPKS
jgi:hypothetical protein